MLQALFVCATSSELSGCSAEIESRLKLTDDWFASATEYTSVWPARGTQALLSSGVAGAGSLGCDHAPAGELSCGRLVSTFGSTAGSNAGGSGPIPAMLPACSTGLLSCGLATTSKLWIWLIAVSASAMIAVGSAVSSALISTSSSSGDSSSCTTRLAIAALAAARSAAAASA